MSLRDEMHADITEMFFTDELAAPALFTKTGSLPITIPVHFTSSYDLILAGTAPADGAQSTALCKADHAVSRRGGAEVCIVPFAGPMPLGRRMGMA